MKKQKYKEMARSTPGELNFNLRGSSRDAEGWGSERVLVTPQYGQSRAKSWSCPPQKNFNQSPPNISGMPKPSISDSNPKSPQRISPGYGVASPIERILQRAPPAQMGILAGLIQLSSWAQAAKASWPDPAFKVARCRVGQESPPRQ